MARLYGLLTLAIAAGTATGADEPRRPWVRAVTFSPDGTLLAGSAGEPNEPGVMTVWEADSLKPRLTYRAKDGLPAVAFAPDGKTLAVACYDGTAVLLDATGGEVKATFRHPKEVRAVAFSPDGKKLATACWDRAVRLWDLESGKATREIGGPQDRMFALAVSPDGKQLMASAGNDGARLWELATGREVHALGGRDRYIRSGVFAPDGRHALTVDNHAAMTAWDVETGEVRARLDYVGTEVVAYSPKLGLVAGGWGKSLTLSRLRLDGPSPAERDRIAKLLRELDDDSVEVREAAGRGLLEVGFVAEAELKRAAAESPSAEVRLRSRKLRAELLTKPVTRLRCGGEVEGVAFTPDGRLLAAGCRDGVVRVWATADWKEIATLTPGVTP